MTLPASALLGQPAPDFTLPATLPGGQLHPLTLGSFAAAGRVAVLVFYGAELGPAMAAQLSAYHRLAADFDDLGADVLGLGADSVAAQQAWSRELKLHFPLLSDQGLKVPVQYGVGWPGQGQVYPAVFTVGKDGRVSDVQLCGEVGGPLADPGEVLARLPR